jgi:hypothetical protein
MLLLNRLSLFGVVLVTVLAGLCTVDAAKGPKVTHKVYFDIKQGDKDLGRSKLTRGTSWYTNFISCAKSLLGCSAAYVPLIIYRLVYLN